MKLSADVSDQTEELKHPFVHIITWIQTTCDDSAAVTQGGANFNMNVATSQNQTPTGPRVLLCVIHPQIMEIH